MVASWLPREDGASGEFLPSALAPRDVSFHLCSLFTQSPRLTPSSGPVSPTDLRLTTWVLTGVLVAG